MSTPSTPATPAHDPRPAPGELTQDQLDAFTARGTDIPTASEQVAAAVSQVGPAAVRYVLDHFAATRVLTWTDCLTYADLTGPREPVDSGHLR